MTMRCLGPHCMSGAKTVPPRFAFAAMVAGSAMLALGPLFVRLADTGPVASAFWRLTLALPVLALLGWREARAKAPLSGKVVALALLAGLCFAADLASWHIGIWMTKMANATLFGNSASVILAVWAIVAWRRWPHRWEALALGSAVIGAWLLMGQSVAASRENLAGDLFCLLAGVLYAGYVLAMTRARDAAGPWSMLAISTAAGALPLLATAWALGEAIMPADWTPLLLLALSSQLIGQGLLVFALPHFTPLVVGLTLLIQPAVAAVAGWFSYGERLNGLEIIGGLLVALALVLVRLPHPVRRA